jgi:hypothetical protein
MESGDLSLNVSCPSLPFVRLEQRLILTMINMPPLKIPAPPTPQIARPRIKTLILGATALTSEPSSKMNTAKIMTCFEGKIWAHWE